MPYELSCPSCHARLNLNDDVGEQYLLCPRCLQMVPHATASSQDPDPAAPTTAFTAQRSTSARAVPSVESDVKWSVWPAYFVILVITLLAIGGFILAASSKTNADSIFPYLLWLVIALTGLVLFPIGRGLARLTATKPGTSAGVKFGRVLLLVVLLTVLAPVAFAIVFFTVCTATLATIISTHH